MKTRLLVWFSIVAAAILIAVYVLLLILPDAMTLSCENRTQFLLDEIAEVVSHYNQAITNLETKESISSQLMTSPDKALGRYIQECVASGWDAHGLLGGSVVRNGANDYVIVDEWGRKLEVEVLHGSCKGNASVPYFRMGNHWVRLWSCGRDGENAGGLKDDIRVRRNITPYYLRSFCLYEYEMPSYVLDVVDFASVDKLREAIRIVYNAAQQAFAIRSRNRQVNLSFEPQWPDKPIDSCYAQYRITASSSMITIEVAVDASHAEFKRISQNEFLSQIDGMDVVEVIINNSSDMGSVDDLLTLLLASGSRHILYSSLWD